MIKSKVFDKTPGNSANTFVTCDFITPPLPPPLVTRANDDFFASSKLVTTSPYGKIVIDRSDIALLPPEIEIQNVFSKSISWNLLTAKGPTLAIYSQVPPIIQRGPQCGLVALSMASYAFQPFVSGQSLLEEARSRNISNHGEMFSASDFADLANNSLHLSAVVSKEILSTPKLLIKTLLKGDMLLVPYDSDRNHTPGKSGGRAAHWGLICGCLLQLNSFSLMPPWAKQDESISNLWYYEPIAKVNKENGPIYNNISSSGRTDSRFNKKIMSTDDNQLVVLWKQGKSRNLIISRLAALRDSNDQLEEYPDSNNEYVIKSVKDGLAGQAIVLSKVNSD